jgi:hypothetical protein
MAMAEKVGRAEADDQAQVAASAADTAPLRRRRVRPAPRALFADTQSKDKEFAPADPGWNACGKPAAFNSPASTTAAMARRRRELA